MWWRRANIRSPAGGRRKPRASISTRYRLLAIDWIGADGALDLPIDAADQADAIAALLDHLGIERADAFIGASYGGMVALQFAAAASARGCGAILVISAAGAAHPFASACRSLQRRALSLGERAATGGSRWPAPWRC